MHETAWDGRISKQNILENIKAKLIKMNKNDAVPYNKQFS